MYSMIYMGGYIPSIFEKIATFSNISVLGIVIDYSLSEIEIKETKSYMDRYNINELAFEDIEKTHPNLIFLCGYTKILKTDLLDRFLFINIHAGILPKWRGFNANCWAMLNGENEIGYSIHRVREGLDSGEIYKIVKIRLEDNETYKSGRERIKEILCEQLEKIFSGIITGDLKAIPQEDNEVVYNCKLKKSDGEIHNWNLSSSYISALHRVFYGGTGVKIFYKEKIYYIESMSVAKMISKSIGIPGSVINKYPDGSILIKAEDTAVRVYRLIDERGNFVIPAELFQIGVRL